MERCSYCATTLQAVVGLNLNRKDLNGAGSNADWVLDYRCENQGSQIDNNLATLTANFNLYHRQTEHHHAHYQNQQGEFGKYANFKKLNSQLAKKK